MKPPRLVGRAVRALRVGTGPKPLSAALWGSVNRDFKIPQLRSLPASQRSGLDGLELPRKGAEHGWEGDYEPPVSPRRTGASRRAAFEGGASVAAEVEKVLSSHRGAGKRSPFVLVDPKAQEEAEASDKRWKAGKPLSPLDGLIVPVKDEFHMAGQPTRAGTNHLNGIQSSDSYVVRRLRELGAIVTAKSHCTEWGLNPMGVLEHVSGPRNPYNPDRAPGGSSTGAGVSVSLGWAASAVGTDGGGSVRIPASLTGCFGIKPTYVRISRVGDFWGASSMAHIGPLGASTADLVDLLDGLSGRDPDDQATWVAPDGHEQGSSWRSALRRGVKGARIGILPGEWADADPEVVKACKAALEALKAEGAELIDVSVPLAELAPGIGALTIGLETAANVSDDYAASGSEYGDEIRILLSVLRNVPTADYLQARRSRFALREQLAAAFCEVDLIAMPTTATTATLYKDSEDLQPILDTGATAGMTRFAFLANLTGVPAGTVPVGLSSEGLPIGLQLVGDAWDEASVFAAMAHCERIGVTEIPEPPGYLR